MPPRLRRPVHDRVDTKPAIAAPPAISRAAGKIVGRLGKKFGFVDPRLLTHWAEIVGPDFARLCRPEQIKRRGNDNALTIRAAHGAAAAQLQHLSPQILGRINRFCGAGAVTRLIITQ